MYGYIYKTTNKLNNKIYIGQKKSEIFLGKAYLGSGKYLKRAINKYGEDNFIVEMLDTAESRDKLSELEIYYIEKYNATNINVGYNIAKGSIGGGEVYVHNDIKNEFIPKNKLDYYLSNRWQLGMLPGRKEINHSATRGMNISKALKGKKQSKEHTANHANSIKDSHFHWYTNGIDNIHLRDSEEIPAGYYRGRIISEETKLKDSLSRKGKPAWNKGLTKETDERVRKYAENLKNKCNKLN